MDKPKACVGCIKDKEYQGLCWSCPKHTLLPVKKPLPFKSRSRKLKKGENDF